MYSNRNRSYSERERTKLFEKSHINGVGFLRILYCAVDRERSYPTHTRAYTATQYMGSARASETVNIYKRAPYHTQTYTYTYVCHTMKISCSYTTFAAFLPIYIFYKRLHSRT